MISIAIILLFLVIPIVGLVVAAIKTREVSFREMLIGIALEAVLMSMLWYGGTYLSARDIQVLNGSVVNKYRETVSCEHSYECFCSTDKDGNRSCQTCYEHLHDYDWVVETSVGNVNIARVDRQGVHQPPRYTAVIIGEPASLESAYTNYIKASDASIYRSENNDPPLIEYPEVFDYYRARHVFEFGNSRVNISAYEAIWSKKLINLSPSKQANVILVFTPADPAGLKENLEKNWSKKNDVVVIMRVVEDEITYVDALAMSKTSKYLQLMRDALLGQKVSDVGKVVSGIELAVLKGYQRRPMEEFEYLKVSISPPWWILLIMGLVSVGGSIGLVFLFRETDW